MKYIIFLNNPAPCKQACHSSVYCPVTVNNNYDKINIGNFLKKVLTVFCFGDIIVTVSALQI